MYRIASQEDPIVVIKAFAHSLSDLQLCHSYHIPHCLIAIVNIPDSQSTNHNIRT